MKLQSTIGILLISAGVVLCCVMFVPESIREIDSTGTTSHGLMNTSSSLFSPQDRTQFDQPVVAAERILPRFESEAAERQILAKRLPTPGNFLGQTYPARSKSFFDDQVSKASGYEIPKSIEMDSLRGVNEEQAESAPAKRKNSERNQSYQTSSRETNTAPWHNRISNPYFDKKRRNERSEPIRISNELSASAASSRSVFANYRTTSQEPIKVKAASFESAHLVTNGSPNVTKAASPEPEFGNVYESDQPKSVIDSRGQQTVLPLLRVNPQVEVRALKHIEYGESLSKRNSYLAAQEEFTLALILIARSHKLKSAPSIYADRLADGLKALDDAADFVASKAENSQVSILRQKISSHSTRLISPNDIGSISRIQALDIYCGYAQAQIQQAIGRSRAGSSALHALGKLESLSSISDRRYDWTRQARALVFFRAAMSCDPANAVCSNDLGVLLYEMGRLQEAQQALKISIELSSSHIAWTNLAAVHQQLAATAETFEERERQARLSSLAITEAGKFGTGTVRTSTASEQWATTTEFQNNAAFPEATIQTVPESRQQNSNQGRISKVETLLQKVKGWY